MVKSCWTQHASSFTCICCMLHETLKFNWTLHAAFCNLTNCMPCRPWVCRPWVCGPYVCGPLFVSLWYNFENWTLDFLNLYCRFQQQQCKKFHIFYSLFSMNLFHCIMLVKLSHIYLCMLTIWISHSINQIDYN